MKKSKPQRATAADWVILINLEHVRTCENM